jgi:voltage-gated potassium channel
MTARPEVAIPRWLYWCYEAVMAALAVTVLLLVTRPEVGWAHRVNLAIWIIFILDYSVRLARARDRRLFISSNLADLVAIMPLDFLRVARLARLVRLLRFLRGFSVLWRLSETPRAILRTNGLGYALFVTALLVAIGGEAIYLLEPEIGSIRDGMWWSLATTTTVGYGDISPKTGPGRIIAAILMLAGIGTIGMITGSIATYFLSPRGTSNPHVRHVQNQLGRWEKMTTDERQQLGRILMALAHDVGADKDARSVPFASDAQD